MHQTLPLLQIIIQELQARICMETILKELSIFFIFGKWVVFKLLFKIYLQSIAYLKFLYFNIISVISFILLNNRWSVTLLRLIIVKLKSCHYLLLGIIPPSSPSSSPIQILQRNLPHHETIQRLPFLLDIL